MDHFIPLAFPLYILKSNMEYVSEVRLDFITFHQEKDVGLVLINCKIAIFVLNIDLDHETLL